METTLRAEAAARPSAEIARRQVLNQHIELRRLLVKGLDHSQAVLGGERHAHVPLRVLVRVTYREFVHHLADEEALIVPILEDDLPIGPRRVELLLEEHERQRNELKALCAWSLDDEIGLAIGFRELAQALLEDIEHEERELLIPEVIRDDGIVVDQCGG